MSEVLDTLKGFWESHSDVTEVVNQYEIHVIEYHTPQIWVVCIHSLRVLVLILFVNPSFYVSRTTQKIMKRSLI